MDAYMKSTLLRVVNIDFLITEDQMILLALRDRKRLKWSRASSADMLGIGDLRWKYESMHEACNAGL